MGTIWTNWSADRSLDQTYINIYCIHRDEEERPAEEEKEIEIAEYDERICRYTYNESHTTIRENELKNTDTISYIKKNNSNRFERLWCSLLNVPMFSDFLCCAIESGFSENAFPLNLCLCSCSASAFHLSCIFWIWCFWLCLFPCHLLTLVQYIQQIKCHTRPARHHCSSPQSFYHFSFTPI